METTSAPRLSDLDSASERATGGSVMGLSAATTMSAPATAWRLSVVTRTPSPRESRSAASLVRVVAESRLAGWPASTSPFRMACPIVPAPSIAIALPFTRSSFPTGPRPLTRRECIAPSSLETNPARHGHRGAVGQERRRGGPLEERAQPGTVERAGVAGELDLAGFGHTPARVLHAVLAGPSVSLRRVSPVVLRDEFGLASGHQRKELSGYGKRQVIPTARDRPGIDHRLHPLRLASGPTDLVVHRYGRVLLVVEDARHQGDRRARHQLLHEHDPPPPTLRRLAPHVEAQVDLLEVAMAGHGDAEDPGAQEQEADHAEVGAALPLVELGPAGDPIRQRGPVHFVVEQRQVAPCGLQERCRSHRSPGRDVRAVSYRSSRSAGRRRRDCGRRRCCRSARPRARTCASAPRAPETPPARASTGGPTPWRSRRGRCAERA